MADTEQAAPVAAADGAEATEETVPTTTTSDGAEEGNGAKEGNGAEEANGAEGGNGATKQGCKEDPTITEEERAMMEEVLAGLKEEDKPHLAKILGNPSRLVKFCRARSHHVKKTLDMLHATATFNAKHHTADILERFKPNEDFETVLHFPLHYLRDKDGNLVLVHRTGHFHGSYFCKYYSDKYLEDLVFYCSEILTRDALAHMEETGATPYITFVLDLDGYGSHVLGPLGITQKLINVFQNNFPETLKRAVVVNTPWLFRGLWKVVSAFVDPVVREKIVLAGSKHSREAVRECLSEDQTPVWLGGTYSPNGDDHLAGLIAQGGKPPKPDLPKGQRHIQ